MRTSLAGAGPELHPAPSYQQEAQSQGNTRGFIEPDTGGQAALGPVGHKWGRRAWPPPAPHTAAPQGQQLGCWAPLQGLGRLQGLPHTGQGQSRMRLGQARPGQAEGAAPAPSPAPPGAHGGQSCPQPMQCTTDAEGGCNSPALGSAAGGGDGACGFTHRAPEGAGGWLAVIAGGPGASLVGVEVQAGGGGRCLGPRPLQAAVGQGRGAGRSCRGWPGAQQGQRWSKGARRAGSSRGPPATAQAAGWRGGGSAGRRPRAPAVTGPRRSAAPRPPVAS